MRDLIGFCLLLGACASTPTSAPLRCPASAATETATTRQAEARRLLSEGQVMLASEKLRAASCDEAALDRLLVEDLLRAQLQSLLREPSLQLRAARILQKLPGGSEIVLAEARKLPTQDALALWGLLVQDVGEARELLRSFVESPEARLRLLALQGLSRVETFSQEMLLRFLRDHNEEVRAFALQLAAKDQPSLVALLAEDTSLSVQLSVLSVLPYLEAREAASLAAGLQASAFPMVQRGALEALLSLNIAREENIALALASDDPFTVLIGVRTASSESAEALQQLQKLLKDKQEAAILLCERFASKSKALAPILIKLLSVSETNTNVLAAEALLGLQESLPAGRLWRESTQQSRQVLEELCFSHDDRSSVRACIVLVQQEDELVSKKLRKAARERLRVLVRESREASARIAALSALQRLGVDVVSDLAAALADPEAEVRLAAAEELVRFLQK